MARPKLDKTLADYMAIAITPALIMLLTGSLVWFLAELGYDGGRPTRIRWILFWFVIGAVLVARIAIENGRAHAAMFLAGLAGATSLTIFKFAPDAPLVPIICLGVVAWCADKLTWDCTLIDESEDASGEGLLQVAGVADEAELTDDAADSAGSPDAASTNSNPPDENRKNAEKKVPFWKRLFVNESERAGKPHAPGLWVVYFSLAALPLYGFGQVWIPSTDVASRHFAFQCLLVYVGAALGLLLMTSFLGLRRYLRQRNLEMPGAMAATWIGMGSAISIGILVVAMLLPRPEGDYSIAEAIDYVSEEVQEASDWAFLDDDGGEGEGQLSGPADEDAEKGSATDSDQQGKPGGEKPGNQVAQNAQDGDGGDQQGEGENGQQSGDKQGEGEQGEGEQTAQNDSESSKSDPSGQTQSSGGGEQKDGQQSDPQSNQQTAQNEDSGNEQQSQSGEPSDNQSGDPQSDEEKSDDQLAQNDAEESGDDAAEENSGDEEAAEAEQAASEPESDSSWMDTIAENMGTLFKWLIYGAIAAAVIYMAIKNWPAVVIFFRNLWAELLGIFGRKPATITDDGEADSEEPVAPPRPFSDFRDPFRSGKASQSSPGELVRYTFEALQAWAFENNCGRTPDQTPMEFGQRLQSRRMKISKEAHEVSLLYAEVAYGGLRPDNSSVATLQKLWRKLT